jgi:hypothetical protein
MGVYQTEGQRAITAGIAEFKRRRSLCAECEAESIGVVILRLTGGRGILLAPLCPSHERLWQDEGLAGLPRTYADCAAKVAQGPANALVVVN